MGEILFDNFDPKPALRKNTEVADWPYKEDASFLNKVGEIMMERFFNGFVYPDGRKMPNPVTAFDDLRNKNTLAQYDLFPDEYGVMYKITHNTQNYEEKDGKMVYKYSRWTQCEVHLHEMIHAWQQTVGKSPYKSGRDTHNKEFVTKCKDLGLYVMPVRGCHYQVADADSPFGLLMKQLGITRPDDVPRADKPTSDYFRPVKEKGKSTLTKWTCPSCHLNVRLGIKEDPLLVHAPCGEMLVRADHGEMKVIIGK